MLAIRGMDRPAPKAETKMGKSHLNPIQAEMLYEYNEC